MMKPTISAVVLAPAAAVALMAMAMALQLSTAAAAAAAPPAPSIGLPGCDTTCGNVSVPYPFGISSGCYWPGLNLTCDRSHDPPRLLLGDGTLRVIEIHVAAPPYVRVVRTAGSIINTTAGDFISSQGGGLNVPFGRGFTEYGYLLSDDNELVVLGCNVAAMLFSDGIGGGREGNPAGRIGGCASFCTKTYSTGHDLAIDTGALTFPSSQCNGTSGCCRSPITVTNPPIEVEAKSLYSRSDTVEEMQLPLIVFVAENGWIDDKLNWSVHAGDIKEAPFLLEWSVTSGLPQGLHQQRNTGPLSINDDPGCRMLCKSQHSFCWTDSYSGAGRTCTCDPGYEGNPYFARGCQDTDECKLPDKGGCYGECMNTIGSMDCWCPYGTYGYPGVEDGCVKMNSTRADERPTVAPAPIGLPNCSKTCGHVSVPYPFGIGPGPDCYLPDFKLTCNTSFDPPRLFLDRDGTLQVMEILLQESTVRVIHHTRTAISNLSFFEATVQAASFQLPVVIGDQYMLSYGNAQATLYGKSYSYSNNDSSKITGCISNFSSDGSPFKENYRHCSGSDGCCHAPILAGSTPKIIEFKWLMNRSINAWEPIWAFISEEGLIDQWWNMILNRTGDDKDLLMTMPQWSCYFSSPLVLRWAVKQGFQAPAATNSGQCPRDIASSICRSKDSFCRQDNQGFTCHCNSGYKGNPYIDGGCQDIDECRTNTTKSCFGDCENVAGNFTCRCRLGTFGNPYKRNGCVRLSTILSRFINKNKIGLSAAGGPMLLLLALGIMLVPRKIQEHRIKVLKQKYFKQNRGQLLQG